MSAADNFEVRIHGTGITGGSYPAEIWGRYMRAWHDGLGTRDYEDPPTTRSGKYLQLDRKIDRAAGSGSTRRPSSSGSTTTTTPPGSSTTVAPSPTTTTVVTEPPLPDPPGPPDPPGGGTDPSP